MKKFWKILLIVLAVLLAAVVLLFAWLTITEYRPDPVTELDVASSEDGALIPSDRELSVMSWNIGYAGLGEDSDFFMDGGTGVQSASKEQVFEYLGGVEDVLDDMWPDLIMLQEVDVDSTRTYHIDESAMLARSQRVHALNYSCGFVPYPLPPIGSVHSGLFTTTDYKIDSAERISLPSPFKWPVSTANLKRCLLVSYLPIDGSDKQLVLVNLHLEAYDDGEGKIAQTNQLRDFITSEYEKGNYVIAGGDFNQVFPGSLDIYPIIDPELWAPGVLDENLLPDGWTLAYDLDTPSCRLLNQPYDKEDENTQHYVIDGFILSPNVELTNVQTLGLDFGSSDHNPVFINVKLK